MNSYLVRCAGLLLALALLAGALPVFAQEDNPPVTDLGSNIYLVDGNQGPIPNLLPAEEVQKIAALQSAPIGTSFYVVASPVSPDDQTVLVRTGGSDLSFLNLRDGGMVPVRLERPVAPLTNFIWFDDNTLGTFPLVVVNDELTAGQVAFDRRSGAVQIRSGDDDDSNSAAEGTADGPQGSPVLFSADGSKLLLASSPPTEGEGAGASLTMRLPMAADDTLNPIDQSLQSLFLQRFPELLADPHARTLADLATLFDPLEGAALLFLGDNLTLTVVDLPTGQFREVVTLGEGTRIVDASFSPDGSKFSVVSEKLQVDPPRGRYDGALKSDLDYRDVTGNLPPAQNPFFQSNTLTVLDFPSGDVRTLRAADGDGVLFAGTSWSSDNRTMAVKVKQPGNAAGRRYPQYWLQYLAGSSLRFYDNELREFRRLERIEISDVDARITFVSPDELIIQSHYRLDQHPYYYNLRSGEFRRIADRPGTFATVVSTNRSREIVFAYSSYTDPVDFYRMNWDGTAFARLTWFNEELRQFSQTQQHPVSFRLRDGSTHTGVLILPADEPFPPQDIPIVVWQEGGPTVQVQNNWFALVESPHALLPNFGFGMLVVPLYGRYGIGPERFEAIADNANYGQVDIDAQAEIANQLRARGWASKVGIVGCSYGGYFATQSITRHPETYDAAHTMCSLVDLFTEWTRGFHDLAAWFQGLPPQAAVAEYVRDSPAYNAERVQTPLLAFHGTNDFLPITIMENFMVEVINNQVPAKMLKFQDADHGFLRATPPELSKAYELYGAQEQIVWFRTYLGN